MDTLASSPQGKRAVRSENAVTRGARGTALPLKNSAVVCVTLPVYVSQSKGLIFTPNSKPWRRLAPLGSTVPSSPLNTSSLVRLSHQYVKVNSAQGKIRVFTPNS